jgi:hypothetical protein
MHRVGSVQKIVETKETLLILHFASDRKQVYVTADCEAGVAQSL